MAIKSKIQWTEATWNPWHGCKKVSPGCKFCYMYRDKERYGHDPTVVLRSKTKFNDPLKWNEGQLIFTCSWSDWFIEDADKWRNEAWKIIKDTPQHTYQILTKRPERIKDNLPEDWGNGYENVWLGVSIESQSQISRAKTLLNVPASIRFLSLEPLLSEIDLNVEVYTGLEPKQTIGRNVDWVIIGGESGNKTGKYNYRPCNPDWIDSIIGQCLKSKTPVFVKQLGTYLSEKYALTDKHGGNINEWPPRLRVRQMPV